MGHESRVIALAGNPNVGKSTVFNSLTGLKQHTGNWSGKTVTTARGKYRFRDKEFTVVDIPGTYSLTADSMEEEVARDFICFGNPDAVIIVADATCLERNLNLVLQILEVTDKAVVCINLIDEAKRKQIDIDLEKLASILGVPVVGTVASNGTGLSDLKDAVYMVTHNESMARTPLVYYDNVVEEAVKQVEPHVKTLLGDRVNCRWISIKLIEGDTRILDSIKDYLGYDIPGDVIIARQVRRSRSYLKSNGVELDNFREQLISGIVGFAEKIYNDVVTVETLNYNTLDRKIDSILTSKMFGVPVMIGLLAVVLWLTITGANYPSELIAKFLFWVEDRLSGLLLWAGTPGWLHGILVHGMYRTLAWVVAVVLPPMAIFFPLFTILEDSGYLPRIAFNLDSLFKKAHAHGKQALTMCMGFGCNAAGAMGCRIIDSPRERTIAIITNNFVPCNGRFPALIAIASIFIGGVVPGKLRSLVLTASLVGVIMLGVMVTLLVSWVLSKTLLKGVPSAFTLELPPYRKPQFGRVMLRSVFDRTIFVLGRAAAVAAPGGLVIWLLANTNFNGASLLNHGAALLHPFAQVIGLDGYILLAFIIGLPANEIVIPIIIMSYTATGSIAELDSLEALRQLLVNNGWTWLTGVCVMLFSLMHFPCGTTLLTIRKETGSIKWTLASFLIPTATGIIICFLVTQGARFFGLI